MYLWRLLHTWSNFIEFHPRVELIRKSLVSQLRNPCSMQFFLQKKKKIVQYPIWRKNGDSSSHIWLDLSCFFRDFGERCPRSHEFKSCLSVVFTVLKIRMITHKFLPWEIKSCIYKRLKEHNHCIGVKMQKCLKAKRILHSSLFVFPHNSTFWKTILNSYVVLIMLSCPGPYLYSIMNTILQVLYSDIL